MSYLTYPTYEILKKEWITKHPSATHQEYQKAMTAIAKKLGI